MRTEIRYLDPKQVKIERPEGAIHPRVTLGDELSVVSARFVAAFPLSNPREYISILTEEEKEVGLMASLEGLDEESAKILDEHLDRRYYSPVISKIDSLVQDAGMWLFDVQTQRGPVQFYVRGWRDSAHEVGRNRWQINSVDGQRFDILDYEALDEGSKILLDRVF